jgi:hypothetical protein
MRKKLLTDHGRKLYAKRKITVEPVYGQIKYTGRPEAGVIATDIASQDLPLRHRRCASASTPLVALTAPRRRSRHRHRPGRLLRHEGGFGVGAGHDLLLASAQARWPYCFDGRGYGCLRKSLDDGGLASAASPRESSGWRSGAGALPRHRAAARIRSGPDPQVHVWIPGRRFRVGERAPRLPSGWLRRAC